MAGDFRCSIASAARGEPMLGTASTVRNWLLLEHPGPWGFDAPRDARPPGGIGEGLRGAARAANVRVLLIRRVGRRRDRSTACFAIHSGPDEPWVERIDLERLEHATTIDVERLGRGEPTGRGERHAEPLFLVCTHGRHDACCAERGRPLAVAMAVGFPEQTWEVSHIGGDRFAANLLVFPHGYYFGRLTPLEGPAVATAYLEGRLDLDHLRGRSCRAMPVQAAEQFLREREGLDRVDDVELERAERAQGVVRARFRTRAGRFEVRVEVERSAEGVRLTCSGRREELPPSYRVRALDRLPTR